MLELGANYVHLLDLDKHIINPINKNLQKYKGKYQIDIGSIEKTSYKNNYFDFILCSGGIHHLENDINGLKEIHRTLICLIAAFFGLVIGSMSVVVRHFYSLYTSDN